MSKTIHFQMYNQCQHFVCHNESLQMVAFRMLLWGARRKLVSSYKAFLQKSKEEKKISTIFSTVILNSTTVNESNVELFSIVKCIITIFILTYKQRL